MELYTFIDCNGDDSGAFSTMDYQEAKRYAEQNELCIIINTFRTVRN